MSSVCVDCSGGDVVEISETALATSGVLTRLPESDSAHTRVPMPFTSAQIGTWSASAPESVSTFREALAVVEVRVSLYVPCVSSVLHEVGEDRLC